MGFVVPRTTACFTLGGIADSDSAYCDRYCRSVLCPLVRLSVCTSVTLVHPVKAVGRNDMPLGWDTLWSQVTLY